MGPELEAHLFICTNLRPDGSGCGSLGGGSLQQEIKNHCATHLANLPIEARKKIRINKAGCLGQCAQGIACVLYQKDEQGQWFLKENASPSERLKERINSLFELRNN